MADDEGIGDFDQLDQVSDEYFDRLKGVRDARFRLFLRGALTVVGMAFGVYFIANSLDAAAYYLKKGSDPIDLGDVRSPKFDRSVLDGLESNSYVSFKNDLIVFDELQSESLNFYYSPLTSFVVTTPRPLPDKEPFRGRETVIELSRSEVDMVIKKLAFAEDLKVSFDGKGRLFRFEDAPAWSHSVISFMSNSSKLPQEKLFLFVDDDDPEDHTMHFYLIIGACVLMLATLAFTVDAWVRLRKARQALAAAGIPTNPGR